MRDDLRRRPIRCLIIRPRFLENTFYNLTDVFRTMGARSAAPALGALVAAAYLPKAWQVRYVDCDVEPLTEEHWKWAEIVLISNIGPQEIPALEIADEARRRGLKTIIGGAGPTLQPEFYVARCDYVSAGEAEVTLPRILSDLADGKTRGIYRSEGSADLTDAPPPRYDLLKLDGYMFIGMNYTRGCPFTCEFCAQIEIFGRRPRTKSPAQMVAEHQMLYDLGYRGMVDFGYDNLIGDVEKTNAVLTAMRDWSRERGHPFMYSTEATMNLAKLPDTMKLMQENDFRYVFVGIESGEPDVLNKTHKGQNTSMTPVEAVKRFNQHGFMINTGLILGFDGESPNSARNMFEMVQNTGVFPSLVLPLHALPNTQLSKRMKREGRLFGAGELVMNTTERTDTATTGLNFVTERKRTDVMRDLAWILGELYRPENHYARVRHTSSQLAAKRKHVPPLRTIAKLARTFYLVSRDATLDPATRWPYWRELLHTLATNPRAFDLVVGSAMMNMNYARQAATYVAALRQEIDAVERVGESAYNARALGTTSSSAAAPAN